MCVKRIGGFSLLLAVFIFSEVTFASDCEWLLLKSVPKVYKQSLDYTCGPASIHSILLGRRMPSPGERALSKLAASNSKVGTTTEGMLKALHAQELRARVIEPLHLKYIQNGRQRGKDYIVNILSKNEGHWAVVVTVSNDYVILMDPLYGDYLSIFSHEAFESIWLGGTFEKPTHQMAIEID